MKGENLVGKYSIYIFAVLLINRLINIITIIIRYFSATITIIN